MSIGGASEVPLSGLSRPANMIVPALCVRLIVIALDYYRDGLEVPMWVISDF